MFLQLIICRHVDISIGSILAFASIIIGLIFIEYPNTPLWLAILITALVGGILGIINGLIVTRFNVHSIIIIFNRIQISLKELCYYSFRLRLKKDFVSPDEYFSLVLAKPI